MVKVPLTQNKVAEVDSEDYPELISHKWYASRIGTCWYASRWEVINGKRRYIYMHRQVMKAVPKEMVDHINRDGLDNRKENLRKCGKSTNAQNTEKRRGKTSKYRGVRFRKDRNRWAASIGKDYKVIQLGHFNSEEEAAAAYDMAALTLFGENAYTNLGVE